MPEPEARESRYSHFTTPSRSPAATESDIANTSTTSKPSSYSTYGPEYDNSPQSLAQWTEADHGVDLHPAVPRPGSESAPPSINTFAPVSPTATPTHHTFDHSHIRCGPESLAWHNTQTSQFWSHDVPGYPPQPANPATLLQFHPSQLIASYFDPTIGYGYDSYGLNDQGDGSKTKGRMETLRKRRHNAPTESSAEQRQTKPRLTGASRRRGTGAPKLNTHSATKANWETDGAPKTGRNDTTVTVGPGGMLSPISPFMPPNTAHDDTEDIPQDGIMYSDEEGDFAGEEDAGAEDDAGADTARLKHNKVERKYRNRLNSHFEQLLGVLPPVGSSQASSQPMAAPMLPNSNTTRTHEHKARSSRKDRERKVSKSEVLDRARLYIQSLESQHERLVAERKELLQMWEHYGRSVQVGPPRR